MKSMVYFVLYIVVIVEMLIVIKERDELIEKEREIMQKMLNSIAELYTRPVNMQVEDSYSFNTQKQDSIVITLKTNGLFSDKEKAEVTYAIQNTDKTQKMPGWTSDVVIADGTTNIGDKSYIKPNKDGTASLVIKKFSVTRDQSYDFETYFTVEREVPDYLPEFLKVRLLEILKERGIELKEVKSEVAKFKINVNKGRAFDVEAPTGN